MGCKDKKCNWEYVTMRVCTNHYVTYCNKCGKNSL